METNEIVYNELARDARKEVNNEFNRLAERTEHLKGYLQLLDSMDAILKENQKLRDENEGLQQQLADEKRQKAELEMKMAETRKISDGVAKNASEEALLKALRTYANRSKRKTSDKRAFAKMTIFEIASMNNITLPDDLATIVETLDDDQMEPKVVNVQGNYNDIHENGEVKLKV